MTECQGHVPVIQVNNTYREMLELVKDHDQSVKVMSPVIQVNNTYREMLELVKDHDQSVKVMSQLYR